MRFRAFIWCLCTIVATVVTASFSVGQVLKVPDDVVRVANDYLQVGVIEPAKRDSEFLQTVWDADIVKDYSDLWLGDPYAECAMSSKAIYNFADSGELKFRGGSGRIGYTFPVYYGDEWVFTIMIALCGETWKFVSGSLKRGNDFWPWVFGLREQYPLDQGYRISIVRIDDIGDFLLLLENEKITHIAPAFLRRRIEGLECDERGVGLFVPVEQVIPGLRAAAIEYKKRRRDNSAPQDENHNESKEAD